MRWIVIGTSFWLGACEAPEEPGTTTVPTTPSAPETSEEPTLYGDCTGHPHIVDDRCEDGACAEPGLSTRVYDLWKQRFLEVHRIDEAHFADVIRVWNVELKGNVWRVDYNFTVDWAVSRQGASVSPVYDTSTDAHILDRIDFALDPSDRYEIAEVAPERRIVAEAWHCHPDIELSFCRINFVNNLGDLHVTGRGYTDTPNECMQVRIDVERGQTVSCDRTACAIY